MKLNHIAIIVSDYARSLRFYGLLGFVETERYTRPHDIVGFLKHNDIVIEMFEKKAPQRVTDPEALGLRHIAFSVNDFEGILRNLAENGIVIENVRQNFHGKRFTFIKDPDLLPIELCEE